MSATGREAAEMANATGRRVNLVREMRRLRKVRAGSPRPAPRGEGERCDLCGRDLTPEHRHMLQLQQRRIDCSCESCWSLHSGDPEYRPVGTRIAWLPELALSDEVWAGFGIPIGLAFFMRSSTVGKVVGLYPSPAGATECELDLSAWETLCEANPILTGLEPDAEGLVVNRLASPPQHAIAPIDLCYGLVGLVKAGWEGISGGPGIERAVAGFFDDLRERSAAA